MAQYYKLGKHIPNTSGGGDIIIDIWNKHGINDLISSHLGVRSPRAEFTYEQGILSLLISRLRNYRRIEKFKKIKHLIENHQRFKIKRGMSPDSFIYMNKELALPKTIVDIKEVEITGQKARRGKRYANHEIITINKFNNLLIDTALKLELLNQETEYVLDYDTTHIETKIADARRYYDGNGKRAYCPAVAMINNIPIYIENRNGNTNAAFNLVDSLSAALNLVTRKGIKVRCVRLDSAAFSKKFVSYASQNNLKYIVRVKSPTVRKQIHKIENWQEIEYRNFFDTIGDGNIHFANEKARLVVKRKQVPIIDENGKEHKDWGLLTNDFEISNEDIISTYELRGESEHLFRDLKEFGWKLLPMRKFEFNTVYLYVIAFIYMVFKFLVKNKKVQNINGVTGKIRLQTFIDEFVAISTYWDEDGNLVLPANAEHYLKLMDET